ncbi:MAG TPA: ATP synthase F0 subunit B [Acidimicrobiales bacterium]|nr:ATP synthase F0 subunit B [Acidimicrobiales bacterium]
MSSTGSGGAAVPETEALLQRVAGMIAGARALPLSSSVKLDNKDEVLELLREASERLPEELRQARWMLKEREEFLAATQRKADELVEAARSEAQRLVQRTEIMKEAQVQARRALEQAREEARRLRLEAEDYADQKLAQFEIVLERTLKTVAAGRQKLAGVPEKDDDRQGAGPASQGAAPGPVRLAPAAGAPGAMAGGVASSAGGPGLGSTLGPVLSSPSAPATLPGRVAPFRPGHSSAEPGPVPDGANGEDEGHDEGIFDQDSLD